MLSLGALRDAHAVGRRARPRPLMRTYIPVTPPPYRTAQRIPVTAILVLLIVLGRNRQAILRNFLQRTNGVTAVCISDTLVVLLYNFFKSSIIEHPPTVINSKSCYRFVTNIVMNIVISCLLALQLG